MFELPCLPVCLPVCGLCFVSMVSSEPLKLLQPDIGMMEHDHEQECHEKCVVSRLHGQSHSGVFKSSNILCATTSHSFYPIISQS